MLKKIIATFLILFSIELYAQERPFFQIVFEPGLTNIISTKGSIEFNSYELIDSASGSFKQYTSVSERSSIGKPSVGFTGGFRFTYPFKKNISLGIGLYISGSSMVREDKSSYRLKDSSLVTLRSENNYWVDASGNPVGIRTVFSGGYSTGIIVFTNRELVQNFKTNLVSIRLPLNIIYSIPGSKFSVDAEACPDLYIRAKTKDLTGADPEFYSFYDPNDENLLVWQLGGGVNYSISKDIGVGFTYRKMLSSIYSTESKSVRTQSMGVRFLFKIPSKKS